MIKNIIFDWSGVLSNDFEKVYETMMRIFDYLDTPRISAEECKKETELPPINFYKKYIPTPDMEVINELYKKFFPQAGRPELFEGIKEVLSKLNNLEIKLIILSSHPSVKKEAEEHGIISYFTEINEDVHEKTKVIKEVLKRNNFNSDETAYVGDMKHDIITGKEGRVKTIGITTGYHTREQLMTAEPSMIIENLSELLDLIRKQKYVYKKVYF